MFGDNGEELDRNNLPIKERKSVAETFGVSDVIVASPIPNDFIDTQYIDNDRDVSQERFQFGIGQNQEAIRAGYQSGWELAGKAIVQSVGEATLGTLEGVGYLVDWQQLGNIAAGTEDEFGNWFSDIMKAGKEYINEEVAPIYQTESAQQGFAPGDASWWASNANSIASTASLLIPAMGATKVAGMFGKGIRGLSGIKKLDKLDDATDAVKTLDNILYGKSAARKMEGVTGAVFSRYMENTMEASGTYDEEYQKLISQGVDPKEAAAKAGEAASTAWNNNWGNLVFDIAQYMTLTKGINSANYASKEFRKSLLQKTLGTTGNIVGEGVEEGAQFVISKEAQRKAEMGDDYEGFKDITTRITEYSKDPEFKASVLLGAVGGGIFTGLGKGIDKIYEKAGEMASSGVNKQKALDDGDLATAYKEDAKDLLSVAYRYASEGKLNDLKGLYKKMGEASDEELINTHGKTKEEIEDFRKRNKEMQEDLDFIEKAYVRLENDSTKKPELRRSELGLLLEKRFMVKAREAINEKVQAAKTIATKETNDPQVVRKKELTTELLTAQLLHDKHEKELSKTKWGKNVLKKFDSDIKRITEELDNLKEVNAKESPTTVDAELTKEVANKKVAEMQESIIDTHLSNMQTEKGQEDILKEFQEKAKQARLNEIDDDIPLSRINGLLADDTLRSEAKAKINALANKAAKESPIPSDNTFESDVAKRYSSTPLLHKELAEIKEADPNVSITDITDAQSFINKHKSDRQFREAVDAYYEKKTVEVTKEQTKDVKIPAEDEMVNSAKREHADGLPVDTKETHNDKGIIQNHEFAMYSRKGNSITFYGIHKNKTVGIALANTYNYREFKEGGPFILYGEDKSPVPSETNTLTDSNGKDGVFMTERDFEVINDPDINIYGKEITFEIPMNNKFSPITTGVDDFIVIPTIDVNGERIQLGKLRATYQSSTGNNKDTIRELRQQLFAEWKQSGQTTGTFISSRNDIKVDGKTPGHFNISGNDRINPTQVIDDVFLATVNTNEDGSHYLNYNNGEVERGLDPSVDFAYDRNSALPKGSVVMMIKRNDGKYSPIKVYTSFLKEHPKETEIVNSIIDEIFADTEFLESPVGSDMSNEKIAEYNSRLAEYIPIKLTYHGKGRVKSTTLGKEGDDPRNHVSYRSAEEMKNDILYGDPKKGTSPRVMRVDSSKINTSKAGVSYNEKISNAGWITTNLTPGPRKMIGSMIKLDLRGFDKGRKVEKAEVVEPATVIKKEVSTKKRFNNIKPDGKTKKDRKRILALNRTSNKTKEEVLTEAGYIEVNGLWIDPNTDISIIEQIPTELWDIMKESGIIILSSTTEGIHHMQAGSITLGDVRYGEIQLTNRGLENIEHNILHEIGHKIYQSLPKEEQQKFDNYEKAVTPYVASEERNQQSGASNAEENFVESFALDMKRRIYGENHNKGINNPIESQYQELFDKINSKYNNLQERVTEIVKETSPSDQQDNVQIQGDPKESEGVKPLISPKRRSSARRKGKDRNRIATTKNYQKWDKNKELLWFNSNYPNIPVKVLEDLRKIADNGGVPLWGMFKNSSIYIANEAAVGTTYHEAFHAVFHILLNDRERGILLKEFKGKDAIDKEENMADHFMEYKLTQGGETKGLSATVKDFFKRLYHLIQIAAERVGLKKGATVTDYMYRVDKGLYNKFGVNNRFSKDVSRFREAYDSGKLNPREEVMAIGTVNAVMVNDTIPQYAELLGLKKDTNPSDVIRELLRKGKESGDPSYSLESMYATTYEIIEDELYEYPDDFTKEGTEYLNKLLDTFATAKDDGTYIFSSLMARAAQDLSVRFGIGISVNRIMSDEVLEADELAAEGTIEGWQIEAFQDQFSKFSERAKMMFAMVEMGVDPADYTVYENPIKVYAKLARVLSSSYDELNMMDKLEDLIEIYPQYEEVRSQIMFNNDLRGEMWKNIGQKHAVAFIGQATDKIFYKDGTQGKVNKVFISNRRSASQDIIDEWQANFYASKLYDRTSGTTSLDKSYLDKVDELITTVKGLNSPETPQEHIDTLFNLLKDINIPVFKSALNRVFGVDGGKAKFLKFLGNNEDGLRSLIYNITEGKDPFFGGVSSEKSLKTMANVIVEGTDDTFKMSFMSMAGKLNYTLVDNRQSLDLLNKLKSTELSKNLIASYRKDPFFKNSPILDTFDSVSARKEVHIGYFDAFKNEDRSKVLEYKDMTPAQLEAFQIANWFRYKYDNKPHDYAYYMLPILADSTSAALLHYKKEDEATVRENLVRTAQQERDRIEWLKERIAPVQEEYDKWISGKGNLPSELSDIPYNVLKNGTKYQIFIDLNGQSITDKNFATKVNEMINKNLKTERQALYDTGVLEMKNGRSVDLTDMLDNRIINNFDKNADLYLLNRMYMNLQTLFLFGGDIASYKSKKGDVDFTDVYKRIKQIHSPQNKLSVDPTRTFKLKNGSEVIVREFYNNTYLQDPTEVEAIVSANLDIIKEIFPDKEDQWIVDAYSNLNNTDAATYIDIFRAREIYLGTAEWNDSLQEQYDDIIAGKPIKFDKDNQVNVKKPFHYSHRFIEDKANPNLLHVVATQLKNSEAVLTPQMAKGNPKLEAILEKMGYEFKADGTVTFDESRRITDAVIFTSAVKVGQFDVVQNVADISPTNVHKMKNSDYAIQQETPEHHIDSSILAGTQNRKIIVQDLMKDAIYRIGNEEMTGEKAFDTYQEAINRNILDSFEELKKLFYNEDGTPDLDNIVKVLRKEAIEKGFGEDTLSAFDWINSSKDATVLPLWHPSISYNVEAIMNSYFKNNITKQKMFGVSLYNASSYGYEEENTKGLRKPKLVIERDKDNKPYIKEVEVLMPAHSKAIYEKYTGADGYLDINAVPDDLKMGLFYRIPTEGKYSMFHIKVIGYIEGVGGQIIMPDEVTTIAGLDFDIDKLYGMMYHFTEVDGKLVKVPSGMDSKEARDNLIIDIQYGIMSHPDTIRKQLTPGNYNTLNRAKERVIELEGKESTVLNPMLPSTQREVFERNMTGAALIGIAANQNVNHSLMTEGDFYARNDIAFDGKKLRSFSENKDSKDDLISSSTAEPLAAFVDNAKDPVASFLNLTTITADLAITMIRAGHDPYSVYMFVASPAAKKFSKELSKLGTSRSDIKATLDKLMLQEKKSISAISAMDRFNDYMETPMEERVTLSKIEDTFSKNTVAEMYTNYSIYELLKSTFEKSHDLVDTMRAMRFDAIGKAAGPRYADTIVLQRAWDKAMKIDGNHIVGFKKFIESNKIPYLMSFYEKGILMPTGKKSFNVELYEKIGDNAYSISMDYNNKRYSIVIDNEGVIDTSEYYDENTLDDVESDILLSNEEKTTLLEEIKLAEKGESVEKSSTKVSGNIILDVTGLPYDKELFTKIVDRFGTFNTEGDLNGEEIANIYNHINTALITGYSTFKQSRIREVVESVPERVRKYKLANPEGAYSILMEQFIPKEDSVNDKRKKDKSPFPYIEFNRTGLDKVHEASIKSAWKRMLHSEIKEERDLARDIATYAFFSTGYTFNYNTFSDIVPVAFISQLQGVEGEPSYRDYLAHMHDREFDNSQLAALFEQIVRNGYRSMRMIPFIDPRSDKSISKRQIDGVMNIVVPFKTVEFSGTDILTGKKNDVVPYIKVPTKTKEGLTTMLYKVVKMENHNVIYAPLSRLGVHNKFVEYDITNLQTTIESVYPTLNVVLEKEEPIVKDETITPEDRKAVLEEMVKAATMLQTSVQGEQLQRSVSSIRKAFKEHEMTMEAFEAIRKEAIESGLDVSEMELNVLREMKPNEAEEIMKKCRGKK